MNGPVSEMDIELRRLTVDDFPIYKSWFSDSQIDRFLGPVWTQQELQIVLNDESGQELAGFLNDELVAVVGIVCADDEHPYYGITQLVVDPKRQGLGIGSAMLHAVRKHFPVSAGQYWICYIDEANQRARQFFAGHGWQFASKDAECMCLYEQRK